MQSSTDDPITELPEIARHRVTVPDHQQGTCGSVPTVRRRLTLRSNIIWTLIGSMSAAVFQWGTLVVLAKYGTLETVGVYGLGLAVANPVFMFTNLQLGILQATDADGRYRFGDYLALRLVMTLLGFLTLAAITCSFNQSTEVKSVLLFIGLAKSFEAISDILYGALQQRRRMDRVAVLQLTRGIGSLVALATVFALTRNLLLASSAMAIVWLACLALVDFPSTIPLICQTADRSWLPTWNSAVMKALFWRSLPLGVAMVLSSLMFNVPQFFVEEYLGMEVLGAFVALAALLALGRKMFNPVAQTVSTTLALHFVNGNEREFRSVTMRLFLFATVIGVAGVLVAAFAGRLLLSLLYTPEYAAYERTLLWLMLAMLFLLQSGLDPAFTALHCHTSQLVLWVLTLILLAGALLFALPGKGLETVAQVVAFTNGMRLIATLFLLETAIRDRFAKRNHDRNVAHTNLPLAAS